LVAKFKGSYGFESGTAFIALVIILAFVVLLWWTARLLNRIQREHRRVNATLRESKTRYRRALDNMLEGCQIIGFDWRYLYLNDVAARYGRQPKDELLGRTVMACYPGIENTEMFAALQECMEKRTARTAEFEFTYPNEDTAWFEFSIQPAPEGLFILTVDITERKRTVTALLESQARLAGIIESAMDAIITVDNDQQIVLFNHTAELMFRCSADEVMGQSLDRFIPARFREIHREHIRAFGETGESNRHMGALGHISGLRADGEEFPIEASISKIRSGGRKYYTVILRDITERQKAEADLRQYAERMKLLHDIDRAILATEPPQPIAQNTLQRLKGIVTFHSASVITFDRQLKRATYLAVEPTGESPWGVGETLPTEDHPAIERLKRNQPYVVHDAEQMHEFPTAAERWLASSGVRSCVGLPLISSDQLLGVLTLRSATPNAFSSRSIEITQEVASQLAIALENARLLDVERQRNAELTALHQASLQLTGSMDVQTVLDTVLDHAISLANADDAHIFLYDGEKLTFGSAYWDNKRQTGPYAEPREDGLTYAVARTGHRQLITDVNQHPLYDTWQWGGAIVGLPLKFGGAVKGVMSLAFVSPRTFDEHIIRALELLADQAAIAVHNAQLYQQIQRYAGDLEQRVTERTAELQYQNERMETILRSSSDAILLLTFDGSILRANRAFCAMFACDHRDISGQTLLTLARIEQADRLQQALLRVTQQQVFQRIELTAHKPDHEAFEVDVVLSPVQDQGDLEGEVVCSLRDITARKQAETELRQALEQEKELNELKSAFVSMVSHEFRTPLAVILTTADLLRTYDDKLTSERRQQRLAVIGEQVRRLDHLINDILLIGRADSMGLGFEPRSLDLVALCGEIIGDITLGNSASVSIQFAHEGVCSYRLIDPDLFRHILQNLVSNAIKYSADGGTVHVALKCTGTQTMVSVRDEGIGIPEEDQKYLFTLFHRARNVGSVQGTGVGLGIVKRAVERHGGTIEFVSVEGEGTTFTVMLPANVPLQDEDVSE
jgi:PAS domain S-box-containing protein